MIFKNVYFIFQIITSQLCAFVNIEPYTQTDSFQCTQEGNIFELNNMLLSCNLETRLLNFSDRLFKHNNINSDNTIDGLCGDVSLEFESNQSHMYGNIHYFENCNITSEIYWKWDIQSLCNTSNKICMYIKEGDIFHIHKKSYHVFEIKDTQLTFEQIAYIQPELWVIVVISMFVCCFGVHSYNIAGTKIVT